jgi:hypothetical protein
MLKKQITRHKLTGSKPSGVCGTMDTLEHAQPSLHGPASHVQTLLTIKILQTADCKRASIFQLTAAWLLMQTP